MVREFAYSVAFATILSGAAAGQQSVGVSAVILERVEATHVDVEVRSIDGRFEVEQVESLGLQRDTRLLQHAYVMGVQPAATEVTVPDRISGGTACLERRAVQSDCRGEEMLVGEPLFIEAAGRLVLTRVIAANS